MAYEALAWPSPPSSTDLVDGSATYNMGILFTLGTARPCVGVQWRVPDSVSTPPSGTHTVSIWNTAGARLASKDFVPVPGNYQDILFDVPLNLSASTGYVAAVYTQHYVFRASGGIWPTSPSGNIVSSESRLITNANPITYPASPGTAWFYVSPLIETDEDPAEGSSALGLELALDVAGGRSSQGLADLGLNMAVAAAGARRAQGAVALDLGLALAAAGARDSRGSAALGLDLALTASGRRTAAGSSALTLNLALAARGSDGEAGRPVKPWPYGEREVSSYPWTPRPVKSFPV